MHLRITGDYLNFDFQYSADGRSWTSIAGAVDLTPLSPAVIEGYNYTGLYLGLYATSNGRESQNHAQFDFFKYESTARSRDHWFDRQASSDDDV